jgi:hypothetical protein
MRNVVRLLSVVLGFAALSSPAFAAEINGTVTFQRRGESETYWAAVLRSEQGKFEVQSPFAVGSPEQPISILLGGAAVFSGDVIRARATVTSRDRETNFLGKVESVVVVQHGRGEPPMPSDPFGWSCQSVTAIPVNLHASVFETEADIYQLRVVAVQGEPSSPIFYPLLRLQGCRSGTDQDHLVYSGETGTAKATLTIREIAGEMHLPASLRLVRGDIQPDDPLGAVSETAMVCTPTRNLDP